MLCIGHTKLALCMLLLSSVCADNKIEYFCMITISELKMQTKSATEKFWNSQLEYLKTRLLLGQASSLLDIEWMKKMTEAFSKIKPKPIKISGGLV